MTFARETNDVEATQRAGAAFAEVVRAGDVVLLSGPLGAGKTAFTQGLAKGLGVTDRVTSPTFTIVREHECQGHPSIRTLHHADVYRTNSADEILDLALGELIEEAGLAVVEWGEMATSVFGRDVLEITIEVLGDEERRVTVGGALASSRHVELERWSAS